LNELIENLTGLRNEILPLITVVATRESLSELFGKCISLAEKANGSIEYAHMMGKIEAYEHVITKMYE